MKYLAGSLVVFLCVGACIGADYYVAISGKDSNTGTSQEEPWASLQVALGSTALAPGDTIHVGAGEFAGSAATKRSGNERDRITLVGADERRTVIKGKLAVTHDYYNIVGVMFDRGYPTLDGCAFVTVSNCEMKRALHGIYLTGGAHDCTIISNEFHHPTATYGMLDLGGYNHTIVGNVLRDSSGQDAIRANGAHTIFIQNNSFLRIISPASLHLKAALRAPLAIENGAKSLNIGSGFAFTVDDSVTLYSASNSSIRMAGFVTDYSNGILAVDVFEALGSGIQEDWQIKLSAGNNHADIVQAFTFDSYDIVFDGNKMIDCTAQLGNIEQNNNPNVRDYTFRNNLFVNSRIQINVYAPGFRFYNNTVFSTDGNVGFRAATATKGDGKPIRVYNNIFCRVGAIESGGPYSGALADYNLMTDYADDSAKEDFTEAHGINGGYVPEEIFVDPLNLDFRLRDGSPAIGKGTNLFSHGVVADILGAARGGSYDMGAYSYEHGSIPARPTGLQVK